MGLYFYFKDGKKYFIYQSKCIKSNDNEIIQRGSSIYLCRAICLDCFIFYNNSDYLFQFNVDTLEKISLKMFLKILT